MNSAPLNARDLLPAPARSPSSLRAWPAGEVARAAAVMASSSQGRPGAQAGSPTLPPWRILQAVASKVLGLRLRAMAALGALALWITPALAACMLNPAPAGALIHAHPDPLTGTGVVRSLESLRDLDYQSWQVVAYREGPGGPQAPITLRIVSYPGRVRMEHPTPLLVSAGRRLWELRDTTLSSAKLAGDGRDAAAEFDLTPLLADLTNNRPLRLELPGVFSELPVPPYVVEEWRSLPEWRERD